jgi:hypothetical protein
MTPEHIHALETALENERPSDRYERILAAMAHAKLDEFEHEGGCLGCYTLDDAVCEVLSTPEGLTVWGHLLKARVRER